MVAPYAGAWIEIVLREVSFVAPIVAPYAGAWIEIVCFTVVSPEKLCRTLRGCVD